MRVVTAKRRLSGSWRFGYGRGGLGLVLAVGAVAACGKKGPPLAPLVPIPAAVESIEATRLGSDVYVTLTLPAANIDQHTPADLARVEIYGYTGRTAPPRARWVELATLVATVPVAPAPSSNGQPPTPEKPGQAGDGSHAEAKLPNLPQQGATVTARETLTPDALVQGKEAPAIGDPQAAIPDPQSSDRDPAPSRTADRESRTADRGPRTAELPLKRFYTAVPFNARGRPGPPGGVAEFPLLPVPDPPPSVLAQYAERAIMLAWEPSGGLIGFLLERALPEEPKPYTEEEGEETVSEPPGPLAYNVYREILPDAMAPPAPRAASWREEPPTPINPAPVSTLEFSDSIEFERRRCYTVRAVRGVGPAARVGSVSPPACVTPVDVFPPAPPRSLATVASEGAISLIWEPNTELDLGGYVVLRGEAPGDTLQPLSAAPLIEAGYRDATVTPGVRYVYAVIAVDNRLPLPNMSAESSRVEETAR